MRRAAASLVLLSALAILTMAVASAADAPDAPDVAEPDVCLSVRTEQLPADAWPAIIAAVDVSTATEARPQLFPRRERAVLLGESGTPAVIAIWAAGRTPTAPSTCESDAATWTATIRRTFLSDGADRMLAVAPTTPGIDSDVVVEWYPDEDRVRTWLEFSGPLGIPNGTCWIDDVLGVADGATTTSTDQGLKTSPFAESACGRFFDYLTRGGAGEQAATLLPVIVPLADGSEIVFVTEAAEVIDDAIVISGSLDIR